VFLRLGQQVGRQDLRRLRPDSDDRRPLLPNGGSRSVSASGWLSLQGFAFRTIAVSDPSFFSTVGGSTRFRFGVTTAGPASGTVFRFRGGGL
jgi:hypothetical protein